MKDKCNGIISSVSLSIAIIINIICSEFLDISPTYLKSIISVSISLVSSIGIIYFAIGKLVHLIWRKKNKQIDINGVWYIAYYANYPEDHYLRIGKLRIKQNYELIEMKDLIAHTPKIENDQIIKNQTRDDEPSETSSSGYGFAQIDISNKTLSGIYNLTRKDHHSIIGLWELSLASEDKKVLRGSFTNKEQSRINNKPISGYLILCRDENTRTSLCEKVIRQKKI